MSLWAKRKGYDGLADYFITLFSPLFNIFQIFAMFRKFRTPDEICFLLNSKYKIDQFSNMHEVVLLFLVQIKSEFGVLALLDHSGWVVHGWSVVLTSPTIAGFVQNNLGDGVVISETVSTYQKIKPRWDCFIIFFLLFQLLVIETPYVWCAFEFATYFESLFLISDKRRNLFLFFVSPTIKEIQD